MKISISIAIISLAVLIAGFDRPADYRPSGYSDQYVDSIPFQVDTAEGWGLHKAYLQNVGDSVDFQLILYRNITNPENWAYRSFIGYVDAAYAPDSVRLFESREPSRTWLLTIMPDRKCYLQQTGGPVPAGNPSIVPIHTIYKK